jgi:hypothetical protein
MNQLAISVRQPWAWLILHAGKDIENRSWPTQVRGRVLVHAAKGLTMEEWIGAWEFARQAVQVHGMSAQELVGKVKGLNYDNIERGGIVGSVEIVNCVSLSVSPWFEGPWGFVLRNPQPVPFWPCRGALGFFQVDMPMVVK